MLIKQGESWVYLIILVIVAILAGGFFCYYTNAVTDEIIFNQFPNIIFSDVKKVQESCICENVNPRCIKYYDPEECNGRSFPLGDPSNYDFGKLIIKGKLNGVGTIMTRINGIGVDGDNLEKFDDKFVEMTGYLKQDPCNGSLYLESIENTKLTPENDIDDTGKVCDTSNDCRYQCFIDFNDYKNRCVGFKEGDLSTYCSVINGSTIKGKCSSVDLSSGKCTQYWELKGIGKMLGQCD